MSRCWCSSLCVPLPFRIRVIFFISELSLVAVFTKKLFAILHAYSLMYFTSVTSCSVRIRVRRLAPNIIRKHLFCATCSFRIKYFAHMDHTGAPYTKIGLSTILKSTKSFTSFEVLWCKRTYCSFGHCHCLHNVLFDECFKTQSSIWKAPPVLGCFR